MVKGRSIVQNVKLGTAGTSKLWTRAGNIKFLLKLLTKAKTNHGWLFFTLVVMWSREWHGYTVKKKGQTDEEFETPELTDLKKVRKSVED